MYDYDDSILANPAVIDVLRGDVSADFHAGRFDDLKGLAFESTLSGANWRDILEADGVIFIEEADLRIHARARLLSTDRFLRQILTRVARAH